MRCSAVRVRELAGIVAPLRPAFALRGRRHHPLDAEVGHEIPVVLHVVRRVGEERLDARDLLFPIFTSSAAEFR